jgi:hypothetical protein
MMPPPSPPPAHRYPGCVPFCLSRHVASFLPRPLRPNSSLPLPSPTSEHPTASPSLGLRRPLDHMGQCPAAHASASSWLETVLEHSPSCWVGSYPAQHPIASSSVQASLLPRLQPASQPGSAPMQPTAPGPSQAGLLAEAMAEAPQEGATPPSCCSKACPSCGLPSSPSLASPSVPPEVEWAAVPFPELAPPTAGAVQPSPRGLQFDQGATLHV